MSCWVRMKLFSKSGESESVMNLISLVRVDVEYGGSGSAMCIAGSVKNVGPFASGT